MIWRFIDGRPGHDNQSLGLVNALSEILPVASFDVAVTSLHTGMLNFLFRRYPNPDNFPAPDLLLGAGHATHWPMLVARRATGGRAIVLMKPSLPAGWFDAAVVPRHDQPPVNRKIFHSLGVLNTVRPAKQRQADAALVMLGGISDDYDWQSQGILEQVNTLIRQRPGRQWTVASSPRTPPAVLERLAESHAVRTVRHDRCEPGWLSRHLAQAAEAWVTEDSVSMLYEALSSGARVGVIKVPRIRQGRVAAGVDALVAEGRIPLPGSYQLTPADAEPLQEARRCADWIRQQCLDR